MLRRRRAHQYLRPFRFQPRLERLEDRTVPTAFWGSFAGTAQHTGAAPVATQPLNQVLWQTPVDLNPPYSGGELFIHYGSPLLTQANTVIVPLKTGYSDGFRVEGHSGTTGALLWTEPTDYRLPPYSWIPSYSPALTAAGRLYFPGAGGTVYYVDNVDGTPTAPVRLAYFGLANYNANPNAYNSTVFINTPITADNSGDIFFGVRVTGSNPANLVSGIVRISAAGNGTWISAAAAAGDGNIGVVPHNCAPALSNDQATLYIGVRSASTSYYGYLVGLNSTTLAPQYSVFLRDPRNNFANSAGLLDDSTASPMVGPDGDVFYGVFGNPYNGSRGFLSHFDSTLTQTKTFGGFGWDSTPSLVPASMVPTYTGTSSYLLFEKYNNYSAFEVGDGGDAVNQIAILDPNDTMPEPHDSSNGLLVMNAVMTMPGPTPDTGFTGVQPNAVREWCINSALVDPATHSVLMPSEDGNLYRWDLTTSSFTQAVTVNPNGIGEAYVPTLEGPDGTVYTIENARLFAVGGLTGGLSVSVTSSLPLAVYGQAVTFTATVSSNVSPAPIGSVTFKDGATVLANVPLDSSGNASYTPPLLSARHHFITASYSGDPNYGPGSMVLVQPVLQTTTVTVAAVPNPSVHGQSVTFTARVVAGGPTANVPEGTVTFLDGATVLAAQTLNPLGLPSSDGTVTFTTSDLATASHSITVIYSGDTNFAGSTSTVTQVVNAATTATALSSSVNPSVYGQAVTFTATVTTSAPGAGTPVGDVTFWDGGTALGSVTLDANGTATFTTSDLIAGGHSITASYNGSTDYAASTSNSVAQVVNPAATATALDSSANPSVFGQAVTFTATVTASAPGAGTPTGIVIFMDGDTVLGMGTLDANGQATFTTSDLAIGNHTIRAVYAADANFLGSTSSDLIQVVA
jgi:hypothetical protein